jgi:fatty acid desaturase
MALIAAEDLAPLLVRNGWKTLAMAAFLGGATVGLGLLAASLPAVAAVPTLLVAGFFFNGLIQLGHESWHGSLFESRIANALFGHLLGALAGVPFRAARHAHLAHHRHNRTAKDPDAYNVGAPGHRVKLQFYIVVFAGLPLAPLHFGLLYPAIALRGRALLLHAVELLGIVLFWGLFLHFVVAPAGLQRLFLYGWVLPLLAATPWNGLKSIADHYANTWEGDALHTATTVRTTRLWSFLWSGLNHHLDHHLYPRVPGRNLHRLHAHLAPALLAAQAPVFEGYFVTFYRAFRAGPTYVAAPSPFLSLGRR